MLKGNTRKIGAAGIAAAGLGGLLGCLKFGLLQSFFGVEYC